MIWVKGYDYDLVKCMTMIWVKRYDYDLGQRL